MQLVKTCFLSRCMAILKYMRRSLVIAEQRFAKQTFSDCMTLIYRFLFMNKHSLLNRILAAIVVLCLALGMCAAKGDFVFAEEASNGTVTTLLMFRLYNPNSGEHFYTESSVERRTLKDAGWRYEGIAWKSPLKKGDPVYRLYNPNAGDHHYTVSAAEKNNLVKVGWKYEGIGWYSVKKTDSDRVAIYRLYNPNCTGAGSHHYTKDDAERDYLVKIGWKDEGIAWYGYTTKSNSPDGSEVVVSEVSGLDNETDNRLYEGFYDGVDEIYETLHPFGYTNAAIAGFAGNAIMESGLNPEIVSVYGYHGIYQFSNSFHWPRFLEYCKEKGYDKYSIQGQTMYVHEVWLDTCLRWYSCDVPMDIEKYKKLLSASDAGAAFQVGFGRGVGGAYADLPTRFDYSSGYKYQTMRKRCEYCRQALIYINSRYGEDTADIEEIETQVSIIQAWLAFLETLEDDEKSAPNGANLINGGRIVIDGVEYDASIFDKTEGIALVAPDGTVYDDGYEYGVSVDGSE